MNDTTTAGLPLFDTEPPSAAPKAPKPSAAASAAAESPAEAPKPKPKAKKKAAAKKKAPAKKKRATAKKKTAKTKAKADPPVAQEAPAVAAPTPEPEAKAAPEKAGPESKPEPTAAETSTEGDRKPREGGESRSRGDRGRNRNRNRNRNRKQDGGNRDGGHRDDNNNRDRDGDRDQNEGRGRNKRRNRNRNRNRDRDRDRGADRERQKAPPSGPPIECEGLLEISNKGFGFLRQADNNFDQNPSDVFVTPETVRTYGLRDGMWLDCIAREGHRGPQLTELKKICGKKPDDCKELPFFEELTAINPCKKITLETKPNIMTTRVIDLITPLGRGQRGLIVAPPRTGKTTLLQHMAEAVHQNHDYMKIFILLVDERPEEVTELRRALPFAEIMASSNDQDTKSHTRIAQIAIERCKRLVEAGEHVFLLLDSITRLARAFNNAMKGNKRGIQKGGMAVGALEIPRRLFAAARNTREAGSLTIIGTALVDTNSMMDEGIFQEFKGTGNMELVLDRRIAEQYIWPAVNIHASGTRREELLLAPHQLEKTYVIRRGLAGHKPIEAIERILSLMEKFPTNAQLLIEIKSQY